MPMQLNYRWLVALAFFLGWTSLTWAHSSSEPAATSHPLTHPCQGSDRISDNWQCIYVAPNGNDKNPGTFEAPFATVERAQQEARALGTKWEGDSVISIRGGTYYLSKTLVLRPEDSGKNGHRLVIRPYGDERVRISGGVPVTGWEDMADYGYGGWNIWGAPVPVSVYPRHLSVNGRRATRARHPNDTFHTIAA